MAENVLRLRTRVSAAGVPLSAHLKTVKSIDAARLLVPEFEGLAAVSTLKEAEVFSVAGIRDIMYAVGISPDKLNRVQDIRSTGCDLSIVVDSVEQAIAVARHSRASGDPISVFIEIDCDGHRSGVAPDSEQLIVIGEALADGARLRGVMTHAGESYRAVGRHALETCAENERAQAVKAAQRLSTAGITCDCVSVGSTPTAHAAPSYEGVTEVRAGVFPFFDLVMVGLGICRAEEVALSVLTTVIGHQERRNWLIVDAGWMALSADRGTSSQVIDYGYGMVCALSGEPIDDLIVVGANQEHGIISTRSGRALALSRLPIGSRLRILPVHACATAAQFDGYNVLESSRSRRNATFWPRLRGW